ncbi:YpiF family protein [Bacillus alkalicellulosilyticus]|uniref:YpiF family protein n=1 Tax=Alkalihalobacterium alkalicellulosilyticum TaxID=1912214 RepID=UPI0009973F4B|nr:YpiF family protein [Bacillus alkalicellulosilyticus]
MKWQTTEMDTYLQAKEYVDTAIIPLIPISLQQQVKSTVAMGEFITIITNELERQFHGRVIEIPPFTYVKSEPINERLDRLNTWYQDLKDSGVVHVVFLTSDSEWKTVEQEVPELLLWLPTIPLEHMEQKYKVEAISDQIKQLIPIMTNKWQNC